MTPGRIGKGSRDALGIEQTSLLALIEIAFGVALVWAAAPFPWSGKGLLLTFGALALGFGVVLAAFASSLADTFGGDSASGWVFIGAGALSIIGALIPGVRAKPAQADSPDIEPLDSREPELRPERSA